VPNLLLDVDRVYSIFRDLFVETVNRHGGDASVLRLPDAGVYGNTHFAMADLNNRDVFALMLQFLHEKRLDRRRD
jgi:hypothetical protein